MWMMDHIANNEINEAFRLNYARIPLKDSAHILHGDALETDCGRWIDHSNHHRLSAGIGRPADKRDTPTCFPAHHSESLRRARWIMIGHQRIGCAK